MSGEDLSMPAPFSVQTLQKRERGSLENPEILLEELVPMNRTIVSDDMDKAADLLDRAMGFPAKRYRYPSGTEYGSWIVPPSWNLLQAHLSDGEKTIASHRDHVLFVAPYSMPFEGWVSRDDLLRDHVVTSKTADDVFFYQHRLAYDYQRQLKEWQISLPGRVVKELDRDRYFVKIDADVRPGTLNVLEYTAPGEEAASVAILTHLCHSGQANDGLSGVLAGMELIQRFRSKPRRFTYKLLILPETIGSAVHVVAQKLSPRDFLCAVFLETMGRGERLYLKHTRTADRPMDLAIKSIVRENPALGTHAFYDGYGNDELVFDFANVGIPAAGIQYYPFPEYHSSRDGADLMDWALWKRAVDLTEELFSRIERDRLIRLKHAGPPYLSRYRLYADAVTERQRFLRIAKLLTFCDGRHTLLQMCEASGISFEDAAAFFDALRKEGLLESDL